MFPSLHSTQSSQNPQEINFCYSHIEAAAAAAAAQSLPKTGS